MDVTTVVTPPPARAVGGFQRWVAQSVPPHGDVLNIGGGCDRSSQPRRVRRVAGRLVAVDPSDHVHDNTSADERHQCTLEEYAAWSRERFDLAFAVFVLEHVADPACFMVSAMTVRRIGTESGERRPLLGRSSRPDPPLRDPIRHFARRGPSTCEGHLNRHDQQQP